jgi:hypothetical protein
MLSHVLVSFLAVCASALQLQPLKLPMPSSDLSLNSSMLVERSSTCTLSGSNPCGSKSCCGGQCYTPSAKVFCCQTMLYDISSSTGFAAGFCCGPHGYGSPTADIVPYQCCPDNNFCGLDKTCCPAKSGPNQYICQSNTAGCCAGGQTCSGTSTCCGTSCAAAGQTCCPKSDGSSFVCGANSNCCGDGCCPVGSQCLNKKCTPSGATICPLGQTCAKGTACCYGTCVNPLTEHCCLGAHNDGFKCGSDKFCCGFGCCPNGNVSTAPFSQH